MSASLVGSEMCIRDSRSGLTIDEPTPLGRYLGCEHRLSEQVSPLTGKTCLLYTSDAADDM
eukprot:11102658-Alexandrium_andersonii.AAC.1